MLTKLIFRTLWTVLSLSCLDITAGDETVTLQVLEGSDVTMSTALTRIKSEVQIQLFYGSEKADKRILNNYAHKGERFTDIIEKYKNHLQLNTINGDLTIKNISTNHTGLYTLQITAELVTFRHYNIRVYGSVSTSVRKNTGNRRSNSRNGPCSPLCSVNNGENVTLSWYKESELISNISSSIQTHSDSLLLLLTIKPSDNLIYKCVATNPVSNHTTLVNIIELCNIKSESSTQIAVGVSAGIFFFLLLLLAGGGIWIWRKHKKQQQDRKSSESEESSSMIYTYLNLKKLERQKVKKDDDTNETVLDETQCVYAQVTKFKNVD